MWRGCSTYFSTSTRSSPKALIASRWHDASAAAKSAGRVDAPHALAAAAGAGLDQHRIADPRRPRSRAAPGPGRRRDSRAPAARRPSPSAPWPPTSAHRADRRRRRADEDDAALRAGLGEVVVLREEAVARMDRLRRRSPCAASRIFSPTQIATRAPAPGRCAPPRRPGATCRASRRLGVDRDGRDAHPPRRLDDAAGDLAAVGDQDLVEHGRLALTSGTRRTSSPGSARSAPPRARGRAPGGVSAGSTTPSSHSRALA